MTTARALLVILAALPLLGADGGGCAREREVAVTVVKAGPQCGGAGAGPSARRLRSPAELAALFSAELGAAPPAADFDGAAVLVVTGGQRPTAGHAVELAQPKAAVKGGVALVTVALRAPAPGAMLAQVITSPCLVLAVPRAGLTQVKVADGAGTVFATVALE